MPASLAIGLSTPEARTRLERYGPNATTETEAPAWRRALGKLWSPVPWMLEGAIVLQLVLHEYGEATVIALLLLFNALLSWLQEQRAQGTLRALKSRLALLACVRRDGEWRMLPASELVPGDLIKLSLGNVVPADVRLLEGNVLLDQSMLTGESLPVEGAVGSATYAGALVQRGEALAEVVATGARTRFGKTAELVRIAHAVSTQQRAVFKVVRNLALFSASMVLIQVLYATVMNLPPLQLIPLGLTAVLAAIPVALPATFTLASALAARGLAAEGVLPTRLSAIDEAGTMDVLCSDKTGTLTQNALAVTRVHAAPGFAVPRVLSLAAIASADSGTDPVDAAIRAAATEAATSAGPVRRSFVPFDPARKLSEGEFSAENGQAMRVVKGAFSAVASLAPQRDDIARTARALQDEGFRVLAVAAGPPPSLEWVGLIALSDPPREDAAALIGQLKSMGVQTVMITGDAPSTAAVIARAVGLQGPICQPGPVPERVTPSDYAVFAGVFPEDKFHIVRAFQATGHSVGMCGDGANDAPALRQAQMGVAVSSATDVAKSAAGLVLTQPGLGGIVQSVRAGRVTYQRILTYTLRSLTSKINQMLFLTVGLFMTGHAILTPMLMVLVMISGDFLAMSATTDHVRASTAPNAWRIGHVTVAAIILGACTVLFSSAILAIGYHRLHLEDHGLRTLAAVTLVCSSQAIFYVVRDRRHLWSSRPSAWVVLSTVADLLIIALLAGTGTLMHALAWPLILAVVLASIAFALLLDVVKSVVFARLAIA